MTKGRCYLILLTVIGVGLAQQPPGPPPPPPPPPRFMTMKGLPLSCFDKPNFEDDGLEFFVCNGGGGLAGVRKKGDPEHTVFVRDPDIAHNLNMQAAKNACGKKKFAVSSDTSGRISFLCAEEDINPVGRFRVATAADWKKYSDYMYK